MPERKKIGLLSGDGIGPEISKSVVAIFSAAKVPIEWVNIPCGEESLRSCGEVLPKSSVERIRELGVALKGPTATPIGKGHRSANVTLRKDLDLFSNVRPVVNLPGVKSPFSGIDLIIVRENTEDVYMGVEHKISADIAQCIKTITRQGSERIARYAFELARKLGRKKVSCVQKANIMKLTDGLFLEVFYSVAKQFPGIIAEEILVDNCCMQLIKRPESFDVLVTENLYGDILSDLCAGLVGGLGVVGGANIGREYAVFEAVHGSAPDIVGKNLANPTALLLSALMMLEHLGLKSEKEKIHSSMASVLTEGRALTKDLGGSASTDEFTSAIISKLR
jgi:NAD-dependent isocitrate dehydrogenase